jgi:UDP-N-acetylmuramate-alanine ligase
VKAFDECDKLVVLDIYEVAGRERVGEHGAITSKLLTRAISRRGISVEYLKAAKLKTYLRKYLKRGDVLLMMGAGTIWDMTRKLFSK